MTRTVGAKDISPQTRVAVVVFLTTLTSAAVPAEEDPPQRQGGGGAGCSGAALPAADFACSRSGLRHPKIDAAPAPQVEGPAALHFKGQADAYRQTQASAANVGSCARAAPYW
ncbi:hypothetical protein ON010_g18461 [Phytophthora cinnamomi]|nr:hypothetical protein ON010_g18461 [Phytophthora cinnamomi]